MEKFFLHHWRKIVLLIILLTGGFLRIWSISQNPPELYSDEISSFVSARSIVETGKDLNGKLLPYFHYRVQLHPPIYGFAAYFSTKVFGVSELGIRMPAVIFGLITIVLIYFLTYELTLNKVISLISAFSLAIIPWGVHFSRIGYEPAALLPFLLSAILFMLAGIRLNKAFFIIISFVFFGLSFYTYLTSFFYSFLFLISIVVLHKKYFLMNKKILLNGLLILIFLTIPFFTIIRNPSFLNRTERIFTFSEGINGKTIRLFINNYLAHLSFNFLFEKGDPNLKHSTQTGELYLWMLPFILIGIFFCPINQKLKSQNRFIMIWLLSFPLAGALTNDGVPHAVRTLIGAPLFCILAGIGIFYSVNFLNKQLQSKFFLIIVMTPFITFAILNLLSFSRTYYLIYPKISQHAWLYGNKQAFEVINQISSKYTRLCLGNTNYLHNQVLAAYYLWETKLEILEDIYNDSCKKQGTILMLPPQLNIPESKLKKEIFDMNGLPVHKIVTID